jgi:predicted ATPase/class 3 adenylate cyclase
VDARSAITTFLFTDIEGSSRLWEREPERMHAALARHDAIVRSAVQSHGGSIVKMTGDGVNAAFADPLDAIGATLALQRALADPATTGGLALQVRCGMHVGVTEQRDHDYYGTAVNRAARIMGAAHGGQILVSQAVVDLVRDRLPPEVKLRDLGSLRLRDLASPEHVHQVVHPGLRQDFPALRSLAATPNNLPQQLTSFVGRERELAQIRGMLGRSRLLTLHGAGGIGKTRLSLQLAAEVLDDYPDGAWFVELAPLTDERLVAQAVAAVVGVKEEAGRPVTDALVTHVSRLNLLLVLDNCEHLVNACAVLAERLLRAAPGVRILASSREPLGIPGETIHQVPALAVPGPGSPIDASTLNRFEAVRLFEERANAALPGFSLGPQNAGAVLDICRQLDGIPLAIELAAARTRSLSVQDIAARLGDRFHLLTTGHRTALPRQQTLRALIDWSHDLLADDERMLFRRLAVFAGGWTLDVAEAVASGSSLAEHDVLDLLTRLVDKSLVTMDADSSRYRLLETVREYARDRLDESLDADATRGRHLQHFVALADAARSRLNGPDHARWLARLDMERENLLAAHAWAAHASGGGQLGLRLVYALGPYWFIRGQPGLGLRLSGEALARPDAQLRNRARCRALFDAGQQCCFTGRYGEAQELLQESLSIARELEDKEHEARVLQPLGMAAFGRGDMAEARACMEQAVELARANGDKRELAAALNGLAQLHRVENELDAAEPLYDQVVALARELADRESVAIGLLNLAMVSMGRGGSADRTCGMLAEVLAIAAETGSKPVGQSALDVCAGYCAWREEWASTARWFGVAQAQIEATGLQRDPADAAFLLPLVDRAKAVLGARAFDEELRAGRALSYEQAIDEVARRFASRP